MYRYPCIRGNILTGMCGVTRVVLANEPADKVSPDLVTCHDTMISRSHSISTTMWRPNFSIRDANHHPDIGVWRSTQCGSLNFNSKVRM